MWHYCSIIHPSIPGVNHAMETFSVSLALCDGHPSVSTRFPSQRASNTGFDFFMLPVTDCWKTIELLVIWEAMALMGRHCNLCSWRTSANFNIFFCMKSSAERTRVDIIPLCSMAVLYSLSVFTIAKSCPGCTMTYDTLDEKKWEQRSTCKPTNLKSQPNTYRKTSCISRTKVQNLNVSCILMQLSSLNPLKPGVKLRMKV